MFTGSLLLDHKDQAATIHPSEGTSTFLSAIAFNSGGEQHAPTVPRPADMTIGAEVQSLMCCLLQEDLKISERDKNIALVSFLGPFKFTFDGEYTITSDHSFDFQFTRSTIEVFGNTVRQSAMSGKPRTYTYVLNSGGVAVARSSRGGLTLLVEPSLCTRREWKPDFLATKL
jgi:hypothetical protein